MSDLQRTLGTVIRRERRCQHLTMKELAERSNVSTIYLSEIERGKKYPSALVLERLAEALGIDVWDLLALVADELRQASQPEPAIGFQLPSRVASQPRNLSGVVVDMLVA